MVIEKQTDNLNLPDFETQSALFMITKERVNILIDMKINWYVNIRLEHLFSQILRIEILSLINYQIYYRNIMK
jgi:hypothetical protein